MTVEEMCRESGVSRASFYRHWQVAAPREEETELRDELQKAYAFVMPTRPGLQP